MTFSFDSATALLAGNPATCVNGVAGLSAADRAGNRHMQRTFQAFLAAGLLASAALTDAAVGQSTGAQDQDILKPEQAFRYTVTAAPDALLVRWTIEPKHYLYRERMSFESRTPGVALGPAGMPAGELHQDEYFGAMHIYRGTAEIRLPLSSRAAGVDNLALAIKSQGCADVGLCYPPQVWLANVSLPAGPLEVLPGTAKSSEPSSGLWSNESSCRPPIAAHTSQTN